MRFLVLGLVFMLIGKNVSGQQATDSLYRLLVLHPNMDTSRVNIYTELAWEWAGVDPQIGLLYADSAERLAITLKFESGRIAAINRRGVNYWYAGKDSLAIQAYQEVLDYHIKNGNQKGQATTINNIALLNYNRGEYRLALENHQKASLVFETLHLKKNWINSLSNEGVVFLALGDYPRAMEVFLKALLQTEDQDFWEKGNIYNNLGLVYKNLQQLDSAEVNFLLALENYQKTGNKQSEASTLGNIGALNHLKNSFDQAEVFLRAALRMNQEIGNPRRIASDLSSLGGVLSDQGKLEDAFLLLDSARGIYRSLDENLNLSTVLLQLAKVREKIGDEPRAVYLLERQALEYAEKSTSPEAIRNAWLAVAHREKMLGDYQKSLASYEKFILFKDSVFNQTNEKKLIQAQVGYEYDLREKELFAQFEKEKILLESQNEREKLRAGILLLLLAALILLGGLVYFFLRKQAKIQKVHLLTKHRARIAELELKALKAQMNPHFIFNALSSISNFLLKNDAQQADRYLTKFSRLIRRILEYSDRQEISLAEEIVLLEDYIALEALRLGKTVELEIDNPTGEDLYAIPIPPLLLQPLVENSLWHGISNTSRPGHIKLGIHPMEDSLLISLKDNGFPEQVRPQRDFKTSSMGLSLVKNRLDKLMGPQGERGDSIMLCENLRDGFEVKLRLAKPFV